MRTLEEVPEGATHWSKRELAKRVGISPTSVHRIWRAFGLQPWRTEDFKISPDPLLIDKIRDVIGLYLAPPANAAVFAVDKKPPGSRSPPGAHHDPLCAMQTREWTSTRTIQNGGSALRSGRGPITLCERTWRVAGFPTLDAIRCPDLRSTSSADQPDLRGWRRSRKGSACATGAEVRRGRRGSRDVIA